jgi:hypothetical protein
MFTLRCTRKLSKRLGINFDDRADLPTTALGDWYATVTFLQHRPIILFVSERSLLSVLLYAKESSTLIPRFLNGVTELLGHLGASKEAINKELEAMAERVFGPTKSRSVLGSMNDFIIQIRASAEYNPDRTLFDHQLTLAEMPCGPMKYAFPGEQTLILLNSAYR